MQVEFGSLIFFFKHEIAVSYCFNLLETNYMHDSLVQLKSAKQITDWSSNP